MGDPCDPCRKAGDTADVGMCFRGRLRDVVLHNICRYDRSLLISLVNILDPLCFQHDVPNIATDASGNHITLVLRCAPDGANFYASTPPIQMNIRCQQSSNSSTDFAIPTWQLAQTARHLELLISDYQKWIWINVGVGQDILVSCTMTEALRQGKNVSDMRLNTDCSADSPIVS